MAQPASASCLLALASMQLKLSSRRSSCSILCPSSFSDPCSASSRRCSALSLARASARFCLLPSTSSAFTYDRWHVTDARGAAHGAALTLIMLTTSPHSCSAASSTSRLTCRLRPIAMARASSRSAFSNLRAMRHRVQRGGRLQRERGCYRGSCSHFVSSSLVFQLLDREADDLSTLHYHPKRITQIQRARAPHRE